MKYKNGVHQYTQFGMKRRVRRLWLALFFNKGFDILVSHAPAYDFNDGEDLPHRGFMAFNRLIEKYRPAYFIHGHIHANYGKQFKRMSSYGETTVINTYGQFVVDFETPI